MKLCRHVTRFHRLAKCKSLKDCWYRIFHSRLESYAYFRSKR